MSAGFAYSNNGLAWRAWDDPNNLQAGGVYFAAAPTTAQLQAAFPGYDAAVAAQQAQATYAAAMAAGLTINSTGTPAVNGTYALDQAQQEVITEVTDYIAKNNAFPGGLATVMLRTAAGGVIAVSTIALWYEISTAIADFIAKADNALITAQGGSNPTWPSASVTIP